MMQRERELECVIADLMTQTRIAEKERDALRAELDALKGVEHQQQIGVLHVGGWYGEELEDWEFEADQSVCDRVNETYQNKPTSLPIYLNPAPAQSVPNIEYSVLRKFADEKRCNFTDLCDAVKQAISTGNGCPVPVQSVPDISAVERDFRWDSEKQHHIPTLLIEFTPVPTGSHNDAKGWKDRDALAAMLAAAPKPEEMK